MISKETLEKYKKQYEENVNYDSAETGCKWDQDELWNFIEQALTEVAEEEKMRVINHISKHEGWEESKTYYLNKLSSPKKEKIPTSAKIIESMDRLTKKQLSKDLEDRLSPKEGEDAMYHCSKCGRLVDGMPHTCPPSSEFTESEGEE